MPAETYFVRTGPDTFAPTQHAQGAWSPDTQHIAPALGVLAHVLETDHVRRRGSDRLVLARCSYDIFGTVPVEEMGSSVRVLRPGRTIELLDGELTHGGRTIVTMRAWFLEPVPTTSIAGTTLAPIAARETMPRFDMASVWPGGFIKSVEIAHDVRSPGHAATWVRQAYPLLDEPTSARVRMLGLVDIANGIAVREDPRQVAFPNVDLTAHLFREPVGEWTGFDTRVSFGGEGVGVTSSTVHDEAGPVGTVVQSLTVRPV